ncbi:GNAT family N-acetyltransferase [Streptomyces heliomycini]|nr:MULTISPECIES: hypothetical protein [Streptomyces]
MGDLRVEAVDGDAVRERVARGCRLENAYAGDVLVDCSTVRPPQGEDAVTTVIARVLPGRRRKGQGTALRAPGLGHARAAGAGAVGTVVPAADEDGVRFAHARGFDEIERYVLPGESEL